MRNETFTLRQLRYFSTAAELGSFRQAALRLEVSQPALTNQIAALEQSLGVVLFERSRQGISISPDGRELLQHARQILFESRSLSVRADQLASGPSGTFTLGVAPTLGPYLLPWFLPELHRRYEHIKLYVREDIPQNLINGLSDTRYDLILTPQPIAGEQLTVAPLFEEPVKLAMATGHPLASKPQINSSDLRGQDILVLEEHHMFYQQIKSLCSNLGARILRDYEGTSLDTLRHMVVMDMGMAFLPSLYVRSEIRDSDSLRVTELETETVSRSQALVWRDTSPARVLFRQIAQDIREIVTAELGDVVNVSTEA